MKIHLDVEGRVIAATLEETAVARDFAALLPLELSLDDYASAEKIADLPRKLSVAEAPSGTDAHPGDISYYAPWGNLALFYQRAAYAKGLVRLGRLDWPGDVDALRAPGTLRARIEHTQPDRIPDE